MTTTYRPPNDHLETDEPRRPKRRLPFDLSLVQLLATGLAAVTATVAASYLGVAGTVVGAALASVVTAVAKELYGQSLRTTGNRVREAVPVTRVLPRTAGFPHTASSVPEHVDVEPADDMPELPSAAPGRRLAPVWRRVALVTMAVFVSVLASLTAVELIAGRPVSDLVRGHSGEGTSFFGTEQVRTKTVPPTAPTVYVTVTPKVVVTTPTVTQPAPTVTKTSPATTTTVPPTPATSTPTPTPSSGTPSTTRTQTP